jgi:hypothetical protein
MSVLQNIGWLLKTTDNVSQEIGIPIIISEYAYPSDSISPGFLKNLSFEVYGLKTIPDWLNATCPKCRITPDYPLTPQGQKDWVHDIHQAFYIETNIAGSFYLCPECADDTWANFSAIFYGPYQTICGISWCDENINKTCDSICSYSEVCEEACGSSLWCNTLFPNTIWFDSTWKSCDFFCRYSEKIFIDITLESENIVVSMNAKNTGTETQTDWKVETELWENLASGEKISPVKASYDAVTGSQCDIANCDCDLIGNTAWNSGETNNITCHIPSSYWGITGENERIMFWVGAKTNDIDKYMYREVPDVAIIVTTVPQAAMTPKTTTTISQEKTIGYEYVQLNLAYKNILVILVAVILIFIIVFGAFKFFARKK